MNGLSKAISNFIELVLIGIVIFLITFCNGNVVNRSKQSISCAIFFDIGICKNKLVGASIKYFINNGCSIGTYFGALAHLL